MTEATWNAIDDYFTHSLVGEDDALRGALQASSAAGLRPIAVSAAQGKLLHLLVRMHGARRILEIGTLGGYSATWLARALPPGGELVTLEIDPRSAEVARQNLTRAGVAHLVDVRVGPALETLPTLAGTFDFFFLDADKENNPSYFREAIRLSRPGSVIVVDNVVRGGAIANAQSESRDVQGVRRLMETAGNDARVSATAIQTVGHKGYDGFLLAVVNG